MDWNDSLILAAGGKYVYLIVPPFLKNIIAVENIDFI